MSPLAMLRQSLSSIAHNGVRSMLTVLGVVIGIAAVISLVALGRGLQDQVASRLGDLDATVVTVSSADPERPTAQAQGAAGGGGPGQGRGRFSFEPSQPTLTAADSAMLADLDPVTAASPVSEAQLDVAQVGAATASQYTVAGVGADYPDLAGLSVRAGTWLSGDDAEVVLGASAAEELFEGTAVGRTLAVAGEELAVVGVLDASDEGNPRRSPDGWLFTDASAWLALRGAEAHDSVQVRAADEDAVAAVVAGIDQALRDSHGIEAGEGADFAVVSNSEVLSARSDVISGFSSTLTGIAAISLLVGGIGIMNIMLVTVTERTREIGLRRAVGARSGHIMAQFLTESVVLTGIGGLLGLGVAYLFGSQIASFVSVGPQRFASGATAVIDGGIVALAVGIAVLVGIVFGLFPAVRAARLDPAEALRYE